MSIDHRGPLSSESPLVVVVVDWMQHSHPASVHFCDIVQGWLKIRDPARLWKSQRKSTQRWCQALPHPVPPACVGTSLRGGGGDGGLGLTPRSRKSGIHPVLTHSHRPAAQCWVVSKLHRVVAEPSRALRVAFEPSRPARWEFLPFHSGRVVLI